MNKLPEEERNFTFSLVCYTNKRQERDIVLSKLVRIKDVGIRLADYAMDGSRRRVKFPSSPKAGWLASSFHRSGGRTQSNLRVYIYGGVRKSKISVIWLLPRKTTRRKEFTIILRKKKIIFLHSRNIPPQNLPSFFFFGGTKSH